MGTRVRIGATEYRAENNYSFTEQAGQASQATLSVNKELNATPVLFQQAKIEIDTAIKTTAALTIPAGGATITREAGSFVTDGWIAGMRGRCSGAHNEIFVVESVAALTIELVGTMTPAAGTITNITQYVIAFSGLITSIDYPEYSTGLEPTVYGLSVSSWEYVANMRKATFNLYHNSIHDIVDYIYDTYLAEEGFTLGAISAIALEISAYRKVGASIREMLDELSAKVPACSWYITPEKVFYFVISSDFVEATIPAKITKLKKSISANDLRTVQTVKGATSRLSVTVTNATKLAEIAALTGGSGKIENIDTDTTIHNLIIADDKADFLLAEFEDDEETISLECHDLVASQRYMSWPFDDATHEIVGDYVVTQRTITQYGPDNYLVAVQLKNRSFFARYGYVQKKIEQVARNTNDALADIGSDDKLTPSEKIPTRAAWLEAVNDKASFEATTTTYGETTEKLSYDIAFQNLANYLNDGDAWTTGLPFWISDDEMSATTDIDGAVFDTTFNAYYTAKINRQLRNPGTSPVVYAGTWIPGAWGAIGVKQAGSYYFPALELLPDGSTRLVCTDATNDLVEVLITSAGVWGDPSVKQAGSYVFPALELLPSGATRIVCLDGGGDLNEILTTDAYSSVPIGTIATEVGTGIVESGQNAHGFYQKFGDGTLIQHGWGYLQAASTAYGIGTYTYPTPFLVGTTISFQETIIGFKLNSAPTSPLDLAETYATFPYCRQVSNAQYKAGWTYPSGTLTSAYYLAWDWIAQGRWK